MQHVRTDVPNESQIIRLSDVEPSPNQCRLFFERESLNDLTAIYRRYLRDPLTVLPDPPIVRYREGRKFELLAGERRFRSARLAGVTELPMRVVEMTDAEAYDFILAHNNVAELMTVELAFRAAELARLGYTEDEISARINGASPYRYIAVGEFVNPDMFNNTKKLCNPGITLWYEAARAGKEHFDFCFHGWNSGAWDEAACNKYFRPKAKGVLPLDNNEKGLRLTVSADGTILNVRGRLDTQLLTQDEIMGIYMSFQMAMSEFIRRYTKEGTFGDRIILNYNPDTLG